MTDTVRNMETSSPHHPAPHPAPHLAGSLPKAWPFEEAAKVAARLGKTGKEGALFATGYMIRLVAGTQLVAGVLLLANRFVPLALLLLAPVIVNIVAFHLFLAPDGLPLAAIVLVLEVALMWTVRAAYRPLLSARSR